MALGGEWTCDPVLGKGTSSEKECERQCVMLRNPWEMKAFILPLQLLNLGEKCQTYVGKKLSLPVLESNFPYVVFKNLNFQIVNNDL